MPPSSAQQRGTSEPADWSAWDTEPSPSSPPTRGRRILIGVLIGVLILAIAAGAVFFVLSRPPKPLLHGSATPQAAVQGFLDALAAGHADQALSFQAPGVSHNKKFLTDAVLAQAHRIDPITSIVVQAGPDTDQPTATIGASYRVGSTPANTTFSLHRGTGRTGWTIDATTITLDPSSLLKDKVPLRLAGVAVSGNSIELFPGTYRATTGLSQLDWGTDPQLSVLEIDSAATVRTKLDVRITASGRNDAARAVKKAADACLAKHDAQPGCGLQPKVKGYTFKKGTIRWRYEDADAPWPAEEFALDPTRPARATGPTDVYADLSGTCTKTARKRDCQQEVFEALFDTPSVDLTAKNLPVSWN